jgi:hypothetical protein
MVQVEPDQAEAVRAMIGRLATTQASDLVSEPANLPADGLSKLALPR